MRTKIEYTINNRSKLVEKLILFEDENNSQFDNESYYTWKKLAEECSNSGDISIYANGFKGESLKESDEYKTLAKLSKGLEVISYPYGYAITDGFTNDRLLIRGDTYVLDDGRFRLSDKDKEKINSLIRRGILSKNEALTEGRGETYWIIFFDENGNTRATDDEGLYPTHYVPSAIHTKLKDGWNIKPEWAKSYVVLADDEFKKIGFDEIERYNSKQGIPLTESPRNNFDINDIIDSDYTDSRKPWSEIKKDLIDKYIKKGYVDVDIERIKSDTQGLKAYMVHGRKKEGSLKESYDYINYNDFLADNFSGYGDDDYIDGLMKDLNKCARALGTKADKLVFYIDYDEDFYAIDDIARIESYISEDYSLYILNGIDIKFIVSHSFSSSYWIFKNEAELNKVVDTIKTYVASLNESLLREGMVDMSDDFNAAREKWDELDIKISFDDALEKWNKTSKLAEPGHWYAKPLYSEQAWNDMIKMFDKQ